MNLVSSSNSTNWLKKMTWLSIPFLRASLRDSNDMLRHDRERDWDAWGVQHEFGIFGGLEGSHVLALLRAERGPTRLRLSSSGCGRTRFLKTLEYWMGFDLLS